MAKKQGVYRQEDGQIPVNRDIDITDTENEPLS